MTTRKATWLLALLLLCSGAGFALVQQVEGIPIGTGEVAVSQDSHLFSGIDENVDMKDVLEAFYNNEPLPAGVSHVESFGAVQATLTGIVDPGSGKQMTIVTVSDDIPDMIQARMYVDGQLQFTATRESGAIVDRPAQGYSIATMTVWLPPSTPIAIEVQWDTSTGTHKDSVELQ